MNDRCCRGRQSVSRREDKKPESSEKRWYLILRGGRVGADLDRWMNGQIGGLLHKVSLLPFFGSPISRPFNRKKPGLFSFLFLCRIGVAPQEAAIAISSSPSSATSPIREISTVLWYGDGRAYLHVFYSKFKAPPGHIYMQMCMMCVYIITTFLSPPCPRYMPSLLFSP